MSSSTTPTVLLEPFEIVFSCAICQKTITDLYRKPRSNQGFSSQNGDDERPVTRLWLTDCGHLTCGDHLDGGAAPFHREDQKPKAPCPLCVVEKGDNVPRELYAIAGLHAEWHDPDLSQDYFIVPPSDLSKASAAFRFQFVSLFRFARTLHQRYLGLQRTCSNFQAKAKDFNISLQETRTEASVMRVRIRDLEQIEEKYARFKEREPEIRRYLEKFTTLAKENDQLRMKLQELGCSVPRKIGTLNADLKNTNDEDIREEAGTGFGGRNGKTQQVSSSSSRKRTHEEHIAGMRDDPPGMRHKHPRSMAYPRPPQSTAPVHTQGITRDQSRLSKSSFQPPERSLMMPEIQIYSNGNWRDAPQSDQASPQHSPHHQHPGDYYMSGALPPRPIGDERRDNHRRPPALYDKRAQFLPARKPVHQGAMDYMPAKSAIRYAQDQDMVILPYDQSLHTGQRYYQHQPIRGASRSSSIRHALPLHTSGGNAQRRESGHLQFVDHRVTESLNFPGAGQSNGEPFQQTVAGMENIHYTMHTPPVMQSSRQSHADHLLPAIRDLKMRNSSPQVRQSLNTLSFIKEPYSADNKPILDRSPSSALTSRFAAPYRLHRRSNSRADSQRSFIQDPRQQPSRLMSAIPTTTKSAWQNRNMTGPFRVQDPRVNTQSTNHLPRPSTQASAAPGVFYPQQRNIYTARGRRSVKR